MNARGFHRLHAGDCLDQIPDLVTIDEAVSKAQDNGVRTGHAPAVWATWVPSPPEDLESKDLGSRGSDALRTN